MHSEIYNHKLHLIMWFMVSAGAFAWLAMWQVWIFKHDTVLQRSTWTDAIVDTVAIYNP